MIFRLSTIDLTDRSQASLLRNCAVSDVFEPGSVFKIVTIGAGLDSGSITPNSTYNDTCTNAGTCVGTCAAAREAAVTGP